MGRLEGKVALITGASYGMGEAAARLFAREGAHVVAIARSRDRILQVVDEITADGFSAIAVVADIGSEKEWEHITAEAVSAFGKIDILVNNAGTHLGADTVDVCTDEHWDQTLHVNAKAVWYGMKAVVPFMRKVGGGSIVNCSSIGGIVGGTASGSSVAYSASKGAVRAMTKDAAISLAPDNIRVNSVHPGSVYTHMAEKAGVPTREAMGEIFKDWIPLPPHVGESIDIAYAYLYLASDEAKFVTGIELPVDGGWLAQ